MEAGFKPVHYTILVRPGGLTTWEALQKNAAGDTRSWRGDWQGDVMKGAVRQAPAGKNPEVFSFFSVGWSFTSQMAADLQAGAL